MKTFSQHEFESGLKLPKDLDGNVTPHQMKLLSYMHYLTKNCQQTASYMEYIIETTSKGLISGEMANFDEDVSEDLVKRLNECANSMQQLIFSSESIAKEADALFSKQAKRQSNINSLLT